MQGSGIQRIWNPFDIQKQRFGRKGCGTKSELGLCRVSRCSQRSCCLRNGHRTGSALQEYVVRRENRAQTLYSCPQYTNEEQQGWNLSGSGRDSAAGLKRPEAFPGPRKLNGSPLAYGPPNDRGDSLSYRADRVWNDSFSNP